MKANLYIIEAELFDYDLGQMTYQPISSPIYGRKQANMESFLSHFDHPTARVVRLN